jgi:hypothetical protein
MISLTTHNTNNRFDSNNLNISFNNSNFANEHQHNDRLTKVVIPKIGK